MRYSWWMLKLMIYVHQHCEYTNGWYSWDDWRGYFDDGLTVAEAFAECHRDC